MTEADLQTLITNGVEESLTLDYKAAGALANTDGKKKEITKDISAMANSAGGRIIYGVREHAEADKKHLPESIDPVDRRLITKEWLEHVASNIRPRITDLRITPVSLSSGAEHVAYVVDIPMGDTAHQALDLRYYRRFNFESVPMYDHEIRDVLGRIQHPLISLRLGLTERQLTIHPMLPGGRSRVEPDAYAWVVAANKGGTLARFVNGFLYVPIYILPKDRDSPHSTTTIDGTDYGMFTFDNTRRDVVGVDSNPLGPRPLYGPSWYEPLLPRLSRQVLTVTISPAFRRMQHGDAGILWNVYADNAPEQTGKASIASLPINRED